MPKDEWGAKRICPTCSTRFYDLRTDPMMCPACGSKFTLDSLTSVKAKPARVEKTKPEPVDIEDLPDIETEDPIADDDDIADDILEDEEDNVDLDEIADVAADEEDG